MAESFSLKQWDVGGREPVCHCLLKVNFVFLKGEIVGLDIPYAQIKTGG